MFNTLWPCKWWGMIQMQWGVDLIFCNDFAAPFSLVCVQLRYVGRPKSWSLYFSSQIFNHDSHKGSCYRCWLMLIMIFILITLSGEFHHQLWWYHGQEGSCMASDQGCCMMTLYDAIWQWSLYGNGHSFKLYDDLTGRCYDKKASLTTSDQQMHKEIDHGQWW